ncbi:uncharacterized protein F5Z01DRAFT_479964 [Emericellopsis atlantica]|uniref:Uncharacterized protein n=1 Tax=Emericellopsis atlantica TaxID=2614577 RepID=A0A9P7ZS28_9HYPO|nr:uncharacterized protein F5Z01DRAFT_479964 [Emericellopsis atlantica]KAG9256623.1 hypothetical protein F5Z01DRAFT_479964 [Emericellopsis atlantica]
MGEPHETKRRFAPVPIETTFQSNRATQRVGPTAELTPEASPVSATPPTREFGGERRRFAPQLIETSRRAYRVGDAGPATKPTDKTDITPYTKNIYNATKPRGRRRLDSINSDGPSLWTMPPTRRETEDPAVKNYLLELAAKEADRQIQEAALAAFPNSRAREGGVAHFYYRESSGSDESPEEAGLPASEPARDHPSRSRRKSSNLGMTWWHKHMQDHYKQKGLDRGDEEAVVDTDDKDVRMVSDAELDNMEFTMPPDALWTTSGKASPVTRRDSGEVAAARAAADAALGARNEDAVMRDAPPPVITKAPELPYPKSAFNKPAAQPAQSVGRPFGQFAYKPDASQLAKASQLQSPPMLGKDIRFRRCPSPKLTKLEPNHPFFHDPDESGNRDTSGKGGLWNGYCFNSGRDAPRPAHQTGPRMLATPAVPGSPAEPADADSRSISEEPASLFSTAGSSIDTASSAEYRLKNGQVQGLHSVDERLRLEKAEAERNEKIAQEFNDEFITQVFNYLSLGYPATACVFDEELAKVSHTSIDELRSQDEQQNAKGHMLELQIGDTKEEDRCPRWRALKTYILEWARQHPNLDNLDPLAWGVRERRGSWAF